MKSLKKLLLASLLPAVLLGSCADDNEVDYSKYEPMALQAWMTQHKPELVDNYVVTDDGKYGFYFDVLEAGKASSSAISNDDMWVRFDISARDLQGNIVFTRNAHEAKLLNTFTKYTRYVPYYRYCKTGSNDFMEGAYLAMTRKLKLSEEYFNKYKDERGFTSREVELREGSKVVLYLPSVLTGSQGFEGSGGYEGQEVLEAQRPVRFEMSICDTVKNPLREEGVSVDAFCEQNGGLTIYDKKDNLRPTDPTLPSHPYQETSKRWVSASDTIAQLYVNYRFDPAKDRFQYTNPYNVGYAPYNDAELDKKISEALVKRFHKDKAYPGVGKLEGSDSVKLDGTAKIWYIGRFMDGFIFDTNIDEVKELIYDKGYTEGSVLSYTPSAGGLVQAFYYTVPNLKFGQWASLITVSTYAYGAGGKQGSTTTTTSGGGMSSADYFNYLNYVNSYYNGYYGGYYDNYYGGFGGMGGYYGGYYDNYYGGYGYDNSTPTVTTKTVTTEIPSFEPLIFQFYIEPAEK